MCTDADELDERLRWLLPGGGGRPWCASTPGRRDFLSRLLLGLLEGPLPGHRGLALAWLAAAAIPAAAFAFPDDETAAEATADAAAAAAAVGTAGADAAGTGGAGSTDVEHGQAGRPEPNYARARDAAKALLSRQRGSAPLFGAYAALEAAAGQSKAARRAYDAALAAAAAELSQAQGSVSAGGSGAADSLAAASEIVVAYAEMELKRGGKDAAPRALHALVWLGSGAPEFTPYRPPPEAAGAADGGAASSAADAAGAAPRQQLLAARRGLQDWIGHALSSAQISGGDVGGSGGGGANRTDLEALEVSGLAPLVAAAALLEELLPAAAPGLVPGGGAAGVRNALRICTQVLKRDQECQPQLRPAVTTVRSAYP